MMDVAGGILLVLFFVGLMQPTSLELYDKMLRERAAEERAKERAYQRSLNPSWWAIWWAHQNRDASPAEVARYLAQRAKF